MPRSAEVAKGSETEAMPSSFADQTAPGGVGVPAKERSYFVGCNVWGRAKEKSQASAWPKKLILRLDMRRKKAYI